MLLLIFQEMQSRVDQIRRELEEQREQDGGVFMSQEKKQELERKSLELENLRKEFRDLSVSAIHHTFITSSDNFNKAEVALSFVLKPERETFTFSYQCLWKE